MSAKTIHRMIDRGELPAVTFPSGRKRVSEQALQRYMQNLEKRQARKTAFTRGDNAHENGDSQSALPALQASDHDHKSL